MFERIVFAEFEWKSQNVLNIKTGELDLKPLLCNYWKDFVLGSAETCFLEFGTYVSLKWATADACDRVDFVEFQGKYHKFFKYKNGGVEPKNVIVQLLKWFCLSLIRNTFSGSLYIRVSKTSHHRSRIERVELLNLSKNTTNFII